MRPSKPGPLTEEQQLHYDSMHEAIRENTYKMQDVCNLQAAIDWMHIIKNHCHTFAAAHGIIGQANPTGTIQCSTQQLEKHRDLARQLKLDVIPCLVEVMAHNHDAAKLWKIIDQRIIMIQHPWPASLAVAWANQATDIISQLGMQLTCNVQVSKNLKYNADREHIHLTRILQEDLLCD